MKSDVTYIEIINALIDKNESDSYELIKMIEDVSSKGIDYLIACKYLDRIYDRTQSLLDITAETLTVFNQRRMNDDT